VEKHILKVLCKYIFLQIGVNLTTDSNTGQLDAYVKNAEWDLEGII
jgi:hypothetical protein